MQSTAGLESCDMCAPEPVKVSTCCSENLNGNDIYFTKAVNTCCLEQVIDKKVKDEFFPKTELKTFIFTSVVNLLMSETVSCSAVKYNFISDSPPLPHGSGRIFIDISLFLI